MLFNTLPILTILAQPFLISLSGSILGWHLLFCGVSNVQCLEASDVGQCSPQRPIPCVIFQHPGRMAYLPDEEPSVYLVSFEGALSPFQMEAHPG